jgi:splicing factor 3B subunit 3
VNLVRLFIYSTLLYLPICFFVFIIRYFSSYSTSLLTDGRHSSCSSLHSFLPSLLLSLSGFLTTTPTLACGSLRNGSCIQIHPIGVRHILKGQAMEWHVPGLNKIECASTNTSQVVIALAGGEIIYFELDLISNKLTEGPKRRMKADVCCLDVGIVSSRKGEQRSLFCAVGCRDSTIQIISLEPSKDKLLKSLGTLGLKSRPNSVKLLPSSEVGGDLILMVGLDDGSSLRATVDPITGSIGTSPTRRFLGARPVSVSRIPIEGKMSLLLLSSRPWISRSSSESGSGSGNASKHIMAPLSYTPLDHGCSFSSEAVPEGVVATSGNTLRIISIDSSSLSNDSDGNEAFNTNKVSLRYTPRQMTLLSTTTDATDATTAEGSADAAKQRKVVLAVVESDYNDYGLEEKTSMGFDPTGKKVKSKKAGDEGDVKKEKDDDAMDEDSDDEEKVKKEDGDDDEDEEEEEDDEDDILARSTPVRGPIPPLSTPSWGSCVRLVDPSNSCDTLDIIEMGRNEAALCCCSVRFHTRGGESLLAVGSVSNLTFHPLKQSSSHISLYRVVNGERLQLLHKTTIESNADDNVGGPILALAHFQGRLLVGIGRTLRLYEMGKRQLLRKCELKGLPTFIKTLQTAGDR